MESCSNTNHSSFVANLKSCNLCDDQIQKLLYDKFTEMDDFNNYSDDELKEFEYLRVNDRKKIRIWLEKSKREDSKEEVK